VGDTARNDQVLVVLVAVIRRAGGLSKGRQKTSPADDPALLLLPSHARRTGSSIRSRIHHASGHGIVDLLLGRMRQKLMMACFLLVDATAMCDVVLNRYG